jgi:DNA-binding transcriptional LysR family regulator
MDLTHYRNFITIVDCGNLSAAAEILHIAQPALTAQVKNMQEKYGATLLRIKRGARSIEVTNEGMILYNKAKYLCAIEDSAQREITSAKNGMAGKLSISLSPSMSVLFIQNFLSGFSLANPDVDYELHEVNIQEQTKQLLSGVSEIGVANAPLRQASRFETLFTRKENLGIIYHKDTHWFNEDKVYLDLEDLEGVPICLSRGCSEQFLNICSDSRIYPRILCTSTTKLSTLMWARQKAGVAVVPVGAGEEFEDYLRCRFVQDERMFINKTLSIVKDRPLSAVAKNFLKYYNEHS